MSKILGDDEPSLLSKIFWYGSTVFIVIVIVLFILFVIELILGKWPCLLR